MYRLLLFFLLLPVGVAKAAAGTGGVGGNTSGGTGGVGGNAAGGTGGVGPNTAPTQFSPHQQSLINPLGNTTITGFFLSLLDALLVFAIPFIVFFIIYAGFQYVTARGNPAKIQKAHMALLYALIGGVIILGAHALLTIVSGTVAQFTS